MSQVDKVFFKCICERVSKLVDRMMLESVTGSDSEKMEYYEESIKRLLEVIELELDQE